LVLDWSHVRVLDLYRRTPSVGAVLLAAMTAACVAVVSALLVALPIGYLVLRREGEPSIGGSILALLAVPNVAIPVFVVVCSLLINLHHRTSWRTPTLAFLVAAVVLIWLLVPFGIKSAPVQALLGTSLGTGAVAWLVSVMLLKKGKSAPEDVIKA
jgi:hypothetical protein